VLILIGILLAGLAMEAVLRIADPIPEVGAPLSAFFTGDPYLGWRGRPNVRLRFHRPEFDTLVLQDADGWRQGDPPPPADAARRVLVLGDSFTWDGASIKASCSPIGCRRASRRRPRWITAAPSHSARHRNICCCGMSSRRRTIRCC
jgi:hypothetical protein